MNKLKKLLTDKSLLRIALTAALSVIAASLFFGMLYDVCNIIGAIVSGTPSQAVVELLRVLPIFTLTVGVVSLAFSSLLALGSEAPLFSKTAKILSAALGCVSVLWVIFGWIFGEYERFVENYPTPLFPLNVLLGGGAVAAVCLLLLFKKKSEAEAPKRGAAIKILGCIDYLVALAELAIFFLGICTVDFAHGGVFYNVVFLLACLTVPALCCAFSVVACVKDAALKPFLQKYLSLSLFAANILIFALYFLAVEIQNEAPNLNAFSVLPIEFSASVHAFAAVCCPAALIPPIVAFLKARKKQAK